MWMPGPLMADDADAAFIIKPFYVFQNKAGRDPFTPRFKTGVFPSAVTVDISTFSLMGITRSGNEMAALFVSKSGVQTGYIFMNGKLTADNNITVSDVAGNFKSDSEILLKQGDKEVLFSLSKLPPVSSNIRPDDIETGKEQPGEY
jgi:hypothetical protein